MFQSSSLGRSNQFLRRDHRKTIAVDARIGFVSGLCVGQSWVGDPARVSSRGVIPA